MWGSHGSWMWDMGGFMGVGWIFIAISVALVVWLLMRGPQNRTVYSRSVCWLAHHGRAKRISTG